MKLMRNVTYEKCDLWEVWLMRSATCDNCDFREVWLTRSVTSEKWTYDNCIMRTEMITNVTEPSS